MATSGEQCIWVERLLSVPARVALAMGDGDDASIRRRPGPGEWSAIEVAGHLVDKMEIWRGRVERIATEDDPPLDLYDQEALVRSRRYQQADRAELLASLADRCAGFAQLVSNLPANAFARPGTHLDYGRVFLRDCIRLPLEAVDAHLVQLRAALSGRAS